MCIYVRLGLFMAYVASNNIELDMNDNKSNEPMCNIS